MFVGSFLNELGGFDSSDHRFSVAISEVRLLEVVHLPLQDSAHVAFRDHRPGIGGQSIPDELDGVVDSVDHHRIGGALALLERHADPRRHEKQHKTAEDDVRHADSVPGFPTSSSALVPSSLMSIQTMRLLFALLALAANAAFLILLVLGIGGRLSPAVASARDTVLESLRGLELWSAFVVALTATLGSLYLSEIADFVPCTLCWYQRIAMYPLVPLLGIAAWRKDHGIDLYAAVLAVAGALIAAYHYLIQSFPSLDSGSCNPLVPCTAAYIRQFDFITIPYMALSAFLLILALLWADRRTSATNAPSSGTGTDSVASLPA